MSGRVSKNTRDRGRAGEDAAEQFLRLNGYHVLERNFYYHHGEIDLVARDGNMLVFVEVKSRRTDAFGAPEESVTPKKQQILRRTAEGYMLERNIASAECRFDVVAVMLSGDVPECRILKDCF